MKGLSYLSLVTSFIVPVILALSLGSLIKNTETIVLSNVNLASTTISQFLEAFVLFEYSFMIHPSIQSVLLELKEGSLRNKLNAITIAFLLVLIPYMSIGLFNYLEYTHSVELLLTTQNIF